MKQFTKKLIKKLGFKKTRSKKKICYGGGPPFITKAISDWNELIAIQPGEHYTFFGFNIKFYDFSKEEHKGLKEDIKKLHDIKFVCHREITDMYYKEAVEKTRFAIYITHTHTDGKEYTYAFILANDKIDESKSPESKSKSPESKSKSPESKSKGKSKSKSPESKGKSKSKSPERKSAESNRELYISLNCARPLFSNEKLEDIQKNDPDMEEGKINISFGIILRCILLQYTKKIGYVNVYNDASNIGLIPYYTRFGFRLGKEKCGVQDKITDSHNAHLIKKTEKMFYDKLDHYEAYKKSLENIPKIYGNPKLLGIDKIKTHLKYYNIQYESSAKLGVLVELYKKELSPHMDNYKKLKEMHGIISVDDTTLLIDDISGLNVSDYKTNTGFSMKLCGNDYKDWCAYTKKQLKENWDDLKKYDDIHTTTFETE